MDATLNLNGVSTMSLYVDPLWEQIAPSIVKWIVGLALTGLLGVFLWPFKRMKAEWTEMKKDQVSIHTELVQQRENCLTTLQRQGETQIELLGKTVAALDGVRLDLAEQTGCLRALTAQPPRVRRAVAKK
jgi:hypothetical protein